jgi:hypothetical protein
MPQGLKFEIPGIRQGLQDALKRWDCREFIQDLLEAAKSKKNSLAKGSDSHAAFLWCPFGSFRITDFARNTLALGLLPS